MSLLDSQNKIIYWDEVNWQWLPFMTGMVQGDNVQFFLQHNGSRTRIRNKKEVISILISKGYTFYPISSLGITEISLGCYLYNGKVYQKEGGRHTRNLVTLLSLISGKSQQTILRNLKGRGVLSKEQIETLATKRKIIEFSGKGYRSYSELAKEYGLSTNVLYRQLAKGFSLEDIVSHHARKRFVDHLDNRYDKLEDMLSNWSIPLRAYKRRKEKGWSLEKILTTPIKREYVDFNGKVFPSISQMAKEYGVYHASILYHMKKGKSPAEALKCLLDEKPKVKDHLGNTFSSNAKMAEHWKVNYNTFSLRIKRGWSLEEALTGKRGSYASHRQSKQSNLLG